MVVYASGLVRDLGSSRQDGRLLWTKPELDPDLHTHTHTCEYPQACTPTFTRTSMHTWRRKEEEEEGGERREGKPGRGGGERGEAGNTPRETPRDDPRMQGTGLQAP